MKSEKLQEEAEAFDVQIKKRVENGHLPDLRRSGRCEFFYNNVWRDQEFANLYYSEVVEKVIRDAIKYLGPGPDQRLRVLEVGCGPGHVSLEVARNKFDVVGIDISGACIELAKQVAAQDPWAGQRGALAYFKEALFDHGGKYDLVLFIASLHHFPDSNKTLQHVKKLLNPNGLIIVDEPTRDLVSKRNVAIILLIKGLLSSAEAFYEKIRLPASTQEAEEFMQEIFLQEKYETENGANVQSINDNEAGFEEMHTALLKHFRKLEFEKNFAFFHQLIGGVRLENVEAEHELARFLKIMDSILCQTGALDPVNFYFVGQLESMDPLT